MKKYLIASIVALTVALVASSVNAAFMRNLTVGSTGTDVAELQTWLISKGYSIPSISSGAATPGYFGAQTKTAVMAYQSRNGLPSTGFFGPLTRASVAAGGGVASDGTLCPAGLVCTPTNPVACPVGFNCVPIGGGTPVQGSTGLVGTDGSIADVNELSQYSSEEVGDSQSDVKVLGFEVEASNDGDILLRSFKLSFDPAGNGSADSDRLDDYIESITVWMGDKEIGSSDVEDFTEDNNDIYTKTVTLKSGVIVKADDIEKFYVSVDGANNLDSGDIDSDSWTVDLENIRFEDGSGVVTTETSYDIDGMDVPIAFVSFSTASDTEFKVSKHSSNPEANIVVVDDQNTTDDVILLVGEFEVEGTSDVVVDSVPVTFTVAGTATGLASTTGSVKLKIGDDVYTESVAVSFNTATASVTFDNLDFTIEAGDTVTFTVLADIESVDGNLTEGDIVLASLTSSNRSMIDAENVEGEQLSSSERSGTAIGEGQEFRTEGIGLVLVSTDTDATTGTTANDDIGLFTIKYKVHAIGETIYLSSLTTTAGLSYTVDKSGTATTANTITAALVNNDDTTLTSVGNYEIEDGESETFTLSIAVPLGTGGTSGQYRAALTGVKWDTSDDTSMANNYTSALDEFKTDYAVLN